MSLRSGKGVAAEVGDQPLRSVGGQLLHHKQRLLVMPAARQSISVVFAVPEKA